jgi:hypothetical protein
MPEKKDLDLSSKIKGWGADADWSKRPGVPRERLGEKTGARWAEPEQQIPKVKINWSIERPGITPVFGTACPPKLLSGLIRNYSYTKFSEGRLAHWLLLLAADRIDVAEEMVLDIFRGKFPNPVLEMGLDEEFTDTDTRLKRFTAKSGVAAGLGIVAALVAFGIVAGREKNRRVILKTGERVTKFTRKARRGEGVLYAGG